MRRTLLFAAVLLLGVKVWGDSPACAQQVQNPYYPGYQLNNFFYYPYYYFPHNYWPAYTPKWPEPQGAPYMRPPAYMAYPAFKEPHWRYEMFSPQPYHRGFHFWLDQF